MFLIAGKILEMEDPSVTGQKLGLYAITVVSGLAIHGLVLLPLLFILITKKNPYAVIKGILQALLIALATSSRYENMAEICGYSRDRMWVTCGGCGGMEGWLCGRRDALQTSRKIKH